MMNPLIDKFNEIEQAKVKEMELAKALEMEHAKDMGPPVNPGMLATPKQLNFIRDLIRKKQVPNEAELLKVANHPQLNKKAASGLIETLIKLPWKERPQVKFEGAQTVTPGVRVPTPAPAPVQVPVHVTKLAAGHYAVNDPIDGVLKFFKISIGKYDRWRGLRFLMQMAGDRHIKIKDRNERTRIFGLIEKDPYEAMLRYGQHIGKCGHCHRQLTDEESRRKGIGPICEKKLGGRFYGE